MRAILFWALKTSFLVFSLITGMKTFGKLVELTRIVWMHSNKMFTHSTVEKSHVLNLFLILQHRLIRVQSFHTPQFRFALARAAISMFASCARYHFSTVRPWNPSVLINQPNKKRAVSSMWLVKRSSRGARIKLHCCAYWSSSCVGGGERVVFYH